MTGSPPLYTDQLRAALERAIGNQYEIVRLLGRGGMGAVYLGVERFLERQVAIKILPAEAARDPEMRERFRREARTAANLTHPNIVPLHTYGEAEGMPYFVMGFVKGESLGGRLARLRRLDAGAVRRVLTEVADALDYAHRRGVVHRDIKPDNILIDEESGRALLADFGVARQSAAGATLTAAGSIVGTPYYMSPEQATGDKSLDGRSDLYSLGIVGFELLSGRRPFDGESIQGILTQHIITPPPSLALAAPEAPPLLVQAIEHAMIKDPARRWQQGKAFRDALQWREESGLEAQMPLGAEKLPSIGIAGAAIVAGLTIPVLAALALGATTITRIPPWSRIMFVAGALVLPALLVLNSAIPARQAGWSWRKILGIAFLEPAFWITWWPRGARRPGSVWDRLPPPVRLARILQAWVAVGALLLFAGAIGTMQFTNGPADLPTGLQVPLTLGVMVLGMVLVVGALVGAVGLVHWYSGKVGLPSHAVLKLLNATNVSPLWERPEIARILLPVAAQGGAAEPHSMAELAARIDGLGAELPDSPLARDAVAAARRLTKALFGLDLELAQIDKDLDPAQLAQVERQLETMGPGEDTGSRRQMRELLEGQRRLLRQLAEQRDSAVARRERLGGLLRTLWLQLAALRAGTARQQAEDAAVSGRVREVCQEIAAHVAATEEVQAAMQTMKASSN